MRWQIFGFVAVFWLVAVGLYLAALGNTALLVLSMGILAVLLILVVVSGSFAIMPTHQSFYLAIATLPIFMFVQLTLVPRVTPLIEPLLAYLILAVTLLIYHQTTRVRVEAAGLRRNQIVVAIALAIPAGMGLAFANRLLLPEAPSIVPRYAGLAILVAASSAFLDEYWFRGILQSRIEATGGASAGWLATAALFAAASTYRADFGVLAFRAGLGVFLGSLVWWRRLLPLTLAIRTATAVALVILSGFSANAVLP